MYGLESRSSPYDVQTQFASSSEGGGGLLQYANTHPTLREAPSRHMPRSSVVVRLVSSDYRWA